MAQRKQRDDYGAVKRGDIGATMAKRKQRGDYGSVIRGDIGAARMARRRRRGNATKKFCVSQVKSSSNSP
jgi:hypothetical protein